MKTTMMVLLCAAATLGVASSASAAGGCGLAFHRNGFGACVPNRGPGPVVIAPGLAIGGFYPGRGYWDGHRYWANRYRFNGGWRYR